MNICRNCKWYEAWTFDDPKEESFHGECHRYPPNHIVKDKKMEFFMFTDVHYDMYCGEFTAKGE